MADIQEEMQKLTKIRDLQHKVILLREELPTVYEGLLKKETIFEAEKLIRSVVSFEPPPQLYIPELKEIDINIINTQSKINFDEIYESAQNIEKCLKYLSHSQVS